MKTSESDVWAAGDIAAFPLKREGGSLTRMEHVSHARLSAALAMAEMLKPGSTDDYDYLPYFYSRIFDLHWEVGMLADPLISDRRSFMETVRFLYSFSRLVPFSCSAELMCL